MLNARRKRDKAQAQKCLVFLFSHQILGLMCRLQFLVFFAHVAANKRARMSALFGGAGEGGVVPPSRNPLDRMPKKRPGKSLEMPRRSLGEFAQDWFTDNRRHQMPDMDGIQAFYPENRILTQLPSENGRFLRI